MRHQAIRNNMADVSAKDGSQETAVGLIGLLLGLLITPIINGYQPAIWFLFLFCTFFHLYANYKAVSSVIFDSLNKQRADLLFTHLISSFRFSSSIQVLSPMQVAALERIFYLPSNKIKIKGKAGDITINFTLGSNFKTVSSLTTLGNSCNLPP